MDPGGYAVEVECAIRLGVGRVGAVVEGDAGGVEDDGWLVRFFGRGVGKDAGEEESAADRGCLGYLWFIYGGSCGG